MIILVLGSALEGMVVALIAIESRCQKEVSGVLHRFGRRAKNLPIARCGILAIGPRRSQNFSSKLVVRRVLLDRVANPRAKALGALTAQELAVALKQVSPFIGPEIDVVGATNKTVHDGITFYSGLASIVEECPDIFGRWWQPGEIQVYPANKFQICAKLGRLDLHSLPLGCDKLIDFAPCLWFLPNETSTVAHDRDCCGSIVTFVTRQNRSFTAAQSAD